MRMRIGSALVLIWLLIGVIAAWQRGYFEGRRDASCQLASTIGVAVIAGPLNYVGVNAKVKECDLPDPSK
jgi:hypothetical protein